MTHGVPHAMMDGMEHPLYDTLVVARALGFSLRTPTLAVRSGILSAKKEVSEKTHRLVYVYDARDVSIWQRRSGRLTYTHLIERCLKLAAELEERDGRIT